MHALNLCTGEVEAGRELCEFETSLVCLQSEFQASGYVVRPLFEESACQLSCVVVGNELVSEIRID